MCPNDDEIIEDRGLYFYQKSVLLRGKLEIVRKIELQLSELNGAPTDFR